MIWLFVYGSLLPGLSGHHLAEPYLRGTKPGAVKGRLYVNEYPALVPDEQGIPVTGEWLALDEAALPALDAYEDYYGPDHPDNEYERVWIKDVSGDPEGWAYVYSSGDGLKEVPAGFWKDFLEAAKNGKDEGR